MTAFEDLCPPDWIDVEVAGVPMRMAVLRLSDRSAAAKKIRADRRKPMEVLNEMMVGLGPADRAELLKTVYEDERRGQPVYDEDIDQWFGTPDGQLYKMWLMFRRYHPEMTLEDIDRIATHIDFASQRAASGEPLGNSPGPEAATQPGEPTGDQSTDDSQTNTVGRQARSALLRSLKRSTISEESPKS